MIKESSLDRQSLKQVVIRFVGDSGDGMQLTGTQFSSTSALLGNDIATFPNYPSEIRAPQGSIYGVSGFQVHIGENAIYTPGDDVDVLVAMNPAALKTNLSSVPVGKTIIVDTDSFNAKNLTKAGYESNPLTTRELESYTVIEAPITSLTYEAIKEVGLEKSAADKSKNMFALGVVYWMFSRPLKHTEEFINDKFKKNPKVVDANIRALKAGYNYAQTLEIMPSPFVVLPAKMQAGTYRILNGNIATAWGFMAAAEKTKMQLFLGSYPITPASDILHELTNHLHFGVLAFQAEDEIAGISSALGAAFAGALAITTTSGPGLALKGEAIGLAVMTELPLVIVNVQRGGPSTGLPTKTEQSDLLQALYGRSGESPLIVIAASTPENCFDYAYIASKLALEHMTPVILLTDGYIANGSAPWKVKKVEDMPDITPKIINNYEGHYEPYRRDDKTLARTWAIPGTPGLEHRIGGLEKEDITGNVSSDPKNHELMTRLRQEKVNRVADFIPELEVEGPDSGDLLVVGWGGTYGSLFTSVKSLNETGYKVGLAHFNYISPLPKNTAEVFSRFKKIIVCELNMGQFFSYLNYQLPQFDYLKHNKIQGLPFSVIELTNKFKQILDNK
ncbi:MAG: 2-oxoacid:acceptor oxidoreductase subunit alpha [Deltaproteobacteria bacterium]